MDVTAREWVGVAYASDRAEAEMIRGLLETAGIASVVQQRGVDGPSLGVGLLNPAGGAHRIMVPANQVEAAQVALGEVVEDDVGELSDLDRLPEGSGREPRGYGLIGAYARAIFWSLGAMGLAFGVFLLHRLL